MPARRRQQIAASVLLFGLFYLVAELASAAAWVDPPYDWVRNFISHLGFADCAVVEGDRICSPLHPLMNAGFLVQGTIFTIGAILVVPLVLGASRWRVPVLVLLVTSGVGTFFVGVFHQSLALYDAGLNGLHVFAAFLAIGPGDVGVLLFGIVAVRIREWRAYGIGMIVLGGIGVIAAILLLQGEDLGTGIGLIERIAVYPLNAWTIGTGVGLLVRSLRDSRAPSRVGA